MSIDSTTYAADEAAKRVPDEPRREPRTGFDLDDEVIRHLAHTDGAVAKLAQRASWLEDPNASKALEAQVDYRAKYDETMGPAPLAQGLGVRAIEAPETALANCIDRLIERHARNSGRERVREIAELVGKDPLAACQALSVDIDLESGDGTGWVDLTTVAASSTSARDFVPGCIDWLPMGKRIYIPAEAGAGKSLLMLTVAVSVVEAGGRVAYLDAENGEDEMAARLKAILAARDTDGQIEAACKERLLYRPYPHLREAAYRGYVGDLKTCDLVVFDSMGHMLDANNWNEDSNTDVTKAVNTFLVPLSQAGVCTVTLDNVGHGAKDRGRGAAAKAERHEIVYLLKADPAPEQGSTGKVVLTLTRKRFDLCKRLEASLGGGVYQAPVATDYRPTVLMGRVSEVVGENPGISQSGITKLVRGKAQAIRQATEFLHTDKYIEIRQEGQTRACYPITPFRDPLNAVHRSGPRATGDSNPVQSSPVGEDGGPNGIDIGIAREVPEPRPTPSQIPPTPSKIPVPLQGRGDGWNCNDGGTEEVQKAQPIPHQSKPRSASQDRFRDLKTQFVPSGEVRGPRAMSG